MKPWKILVTARAFSVSGSQARTQLVACGCEVIEAACFGPLTRQQLVNAAGDCQAVIAATDPYDSATFQALPGLKLVARCGVGIDSVDLAAATEEGVLVTNVPYAMTDAVADYCLGLLLTLVRRIHEGFNCMVAGGWTEYPGVELRGKQLGLIGFGKIGQAVADRARGFGLRMVAHDPALAAQGPLTAYPDVGWVALDELLAESHFVSVHAPNIFATRNLIGAEALRKMRPDSFLINTSRGALVDESALMQALQEGWIAGAAIDVYCNEPLPADHPLRSTPRLLLTPHNAFNSQEAAVRMSVGCSQPILDVLGGQVPEFLCNPDVLRSPKLRIAN
jgi:phosphoglycerate dehydrogenase-like enzyme